ncbi:tyrosine-type recombinase/integrase [Chloroflexota bacterium]
MTAYYLVRLVLSLNQKGKDYYAYLSLILFLFTKSQRHFRSFYAIGLEEIRLHDAHQSYASFMVKQGVHPKVVQESLGHATISTTLGLYSHVSPRLQQAVAEGFDNILLVKNRLQEIISSKYQLCLVVPS